MLLLLLILRLSPWGCRGLDDGHSLLLNWGMLLELLDNGLFTRWHVGLELVLRLGLDEIDSVIVQVLELLVDQLDLTVGERVPTAVYEALDGRKLVDVDHVVVSLQVDRVKVLLNDARLNVCSVTLVQLHLDDRAEDPEQVLRQVLALRHTLLLDHHILRGLPQELEEGGL